MGHNIDPWGTPSKTKSQSLKEEEIRTRCILFDK